MKRLTPLLMVALFSGIVFSALPETSSAFSDVSKSTAYGQAIIELQQKGILKGYADGTFRSEAQINRAEFLKLVLEGRGNVGAQVFKGSECFADVGDQWFAKYVCSARNEGIIEGYSDKTFKPERPISFVEAAKILSKAYEQKIESSGENWYEAYVNALEDSKAIPPSINSLEQQITRAEMAEMMWRLREKKTDQPTKGLLNIKYPETKVNFASDSVQTAKSCADLTAVLNSAGSSYGRGYGRGLIMEDAFTPAPAMLKSMAAESPAQSTTGDYTRTNVQVEGVDEADIVKTDGTYVYMISDGKVRIVKARPGDSMRLASTIEYKAGVTPQDLYVSGNHRIVVAGSYKKYPFPKPVPMMKERGEGFAMPVQSYQTTEVFIYDLKEGQAKEVRNVSFEGNTVSSRLTGGKVYLVMRTGSRWYGIIPLKAAEDDILPRFSDSRKGGKETALSKCADVSILPHVLSPEFVTVAVIPDDASGEIKKKMILGSADNVYASQKNLYVATTEWKYSWGVREDDEDKEETDSSETTNVYRFEFTGDGVELASKGKVPGHILNQFAMDENGGTFRIATTIQTSWRGGGEEKQSTNNLYVLGLDLKLQGELTGIAPGESIYAVRFIGDRAYIVTFKQVDPLFVIDTSDPKNPKILGKLKIPGYSNYLHPYDENHLIGFGKAVDESIDQDKVHNPDAVYYTAIQGVKMALFDVSDVSNPKELFKEVIGDRGSDSPLLTNHKALLFDKERGLLSFPVLVTKRPAGSDPSADGNPVFQGAYVYSLSLKNGFDLKGKITHYLSTDEFLKAGSYWYGGTSDIQRILRIDNSLLTISDDQVRSTVWPEIKEEG